VTQRLFPNVSELLARRRPRPAGQPKESYGDRSFQGIGKTTREAKQAAAKAALTKLRATMPGIKFKPGVIPFEWRARGVPSF
jgi:hypothetical protein